MKEAWQRFPGVYAQLSGLASKAATAKYKWYWTDVVEKVWRWPPVQVTASPHRMHGVGLKTNLYWRKRQHGL